jgi:hypothetical protein
MSIVENLLMGVDGLGRGLTTEISGFAAGKIGWNELLSDSIFQI